MSSLAGKTYRVENGKKSYVFGVCESPGESCLEKTGACEITNGQSTSLGAVNNELQLSEDGSGSPYLNYPSGSACGALHKQWNTTIEFICLTDGMSPKPTVLEDTGCRLIIHFPTKLACQTMVMR